MQRQQGFATGARGQGEPALVPGQVRVQQQPNHAQHAVHGGADFVAHVGQKLALGGAGQLSPDRHLVGVCGGFFELVVGLQQGFLGLLLGGNVAGRSAWRNGWPVSSMRVSNTVAGKSVPSSRRCVHSKKCEPSRRATSIASRALSAKGCHPAAVPD